MLLGREAEQRVVDELLQTARGGRSAVLVFRGEPGIGKTTLLDYAERSAGDMTVLRCVGIQAEHESASLTTRQLQGAEPIAGRLRSRDAVEESFRVRVAHLPADARHVLLLAASEEGGDLQALERCGLSASAFEAAETAGLVQVDGAVVFRHPLVRSAVYHSATRGERRAAHQALAAAVEDPVRSAWRRALAADRADEAIAAELEVAGAEAVARGAPATAAAAYERAAELSQQAPRKARRLLCAAQTSLAAGFSDAALTLVERARPLTADQVGVAELDLICATISMRQGPPVHAFDLVRNAAVALAERKPERALEMVAWMVLAASAGGWVTAGIGDAREVIERVRGDGAGREFMCAFLDGAIALRDGDAALAAERFGAAFQIEAGIAVSPMMTTMAGQAGMWLTDYPPARDRFARLVAQRRAEGSLPDLVLALFFLAAGEMCTGGVQAGFDASAEGLEIVRQLGSANDETNYLALHAWITALLGKEQECRDCAAMARRQGLAAGLGWAVSEAYHALAELELGLGNAAGAIEHYEQMDAGPFSPEAMLATPGVIDAALRLGEPERAVLALDRFAAWAPVSRTPLVDGILARCRAVMTEDTAQADDLFAQALGYHDHRVPPYERARTQLAYGERLRRDRRITEARIQLRSALDTFEGISAPLWAERARGELRATGETARKRDLSSLDTLTPQERRVARLVAAGASNKDAAAQLFLSRRTVEYHLGKVFTKLGVTSRVELARLPLDPVLTGQSA